MIAKTDRRDQDFGSGRFRPFVDAAAGQRISIWKSHAGDARVGGDWCEAFSTPAGTVVLTVGDVSGHGLPVAAGMEIVRASVLRAISASQVPSEVLLAANHAASSWGEGILATAIVAIFDSGAQTLTFANAGHPPPLLLGADQHRFLERYPADLPLGILKCDRAVNHVVALPADALLVLYTDGITEHSRDPIRGEQELIAAARFFYGRPEPNTAHAIAHRVLDACRGSDDAAAMAFYITPAPSVAMNGGAAKNGSNGKA